MTLDYNQYTKVCHFCTDKINNHFVQYIKVQDNI